MISRYCRFVETYYSDHNIRSIFCPRVTNNFAKITWSLIKDTWRKGRLKCRWNRALLVQDFSWQHLSQHRLGLLIVSQADEPVVVDSWCSQLVMGLVRSFFLFPLMVESLWRICEVNKHTFASTWITKIFCSTVLLQLQRYSTNKGYQKCKVQSAMIVFVWSVQLL